MRGGRRGRERRESGGGECSVEAILYITILLYYIATLLYHK